MARKAEKKYSHQHLVITRIHGVWNLIPIAFIGSGFDK